MGAYERILKSLSRVGAAGLFEKYLAARTAGHYIRALGYHGTPASSLPLLRRHFEYIGKHFDPVDENSLAAFLSGSRTGGGGQARKRPGAIISFDDGLCDNYEVAAPLLEEFGLVGWFFVTSTLPGLPAEEQEGFCRDRTIRAGGFSSSGGTGAGGGKRVGMDWAEIRDLAARGHVIGCHTATHMRFMAGTKPDIMERELAESRERMRRELGRAPGAFAWVGGESVSTYDPCGFLAIKEAGFRFAFTTKSCPILPGADPLVLHRTIIDSDTDFDVFCMKISGISDLAHRKTRKQIEEGFRTGPERAGLPATGGNAPGPGDTSS